MAQKRQGKVKIKWSSNFAYAIGLLTSDGCLSNDERHITFVSKDKEQIENFLKALNIDVLIGEHNPNDPKRQAFRVQFSDVSFYEFLNSIGITKAKSLTIGEIDIPKKYFADFLRGHFDGDGYSYSYFDPRWKSSFMFYIGFACASKKFIDWLQKNIFLHTGITGHITRQAKKSHCLQLKYAKNEAKELVKFMYYKKDVLCLSRKRLKIKQSLYTIAHTSDGRLKKLAHT